MRGNKIDEHILSSGKDEVYSLHTLLDLDVDCY